MNLRPRLTFENVAATIALVLAIGGGTVYAASNLGKNDVKSPNIAPGAVKASDLGTNAVTSPKIRNGTIKAADIAGGVMHNDIPDVTGSATGGPVTGLNTTTPVTVPLTGTTTFTPQQGQVSALVLDGQFTYAKAGASNCAPRVGLLVNGQPTRAVAVPPGTTSTTPITGRGYDVDGPFGLIDPGTPITFSALAVGDSDCSAGTQLDKVVVGIVQIH
jgi:hypothetical protein